jgi:hypothetical protein
MSQVKAGQVINAESGSEKLTALASHTVTRKPIDHIG